MIDPALFGLVLLPVMFFWAGCPCCDVCSRRCSTGGPQQIQIVVAGYVDGANQFIECDEDCSQKNGTFVANRTTVFDDCRWSAAGNVWCDSGGNDTCSDTVSLLVSGDGPWNLFGSVTIDHAPGKTCFACGSAGLVPCADSFFKQETNKPNCKTWSNYDIPFDNSLTNCDATNVTFTITSL